MGTKSSAYQGCLMGLAVGDALGYSVDNKTWEQICADYGPNGLLGYDLQGDYADVTSYTQIAAYVCNALLLSISRSPSAPRLPFVTLGLKEWARNQRYYRDPERTFCWISCLPAFRGRHCRDVRMLDALRLQTLGTLERPQNRGDTPGALTEAVAIGLFYEPERMSPQQIGELAAKSAVLTHGSQEAVLANVVLAYAAAGILQDPEIPLKEQFRQAVAAMQGQFPGQDADALSAYLLPVINTEDTSPSREVLENLQCLTARECLAGAVYACLTCGDDFDRAMIAAVNHSGFSAAVGALTGAILGAKLGIEALPDFYLESIEPREALGILAEDLLCSTPAAGLFDDDWDQKYVQGRPL